MRNKRRWWRKHRPQKAIKIYADYQRNWESLIPTLHRFRLESVDFLSIAGMAPKDFITDREYSPGHHSRRGQGYIAKVGSKFYPNESITEHLITRLGQTYDINIAD